MFACPSKANQATTGLLCALFKQNTGTHTHTAGQAVGLCHAFDTMLPKCLKCNVRAALFYYIWTVI